MGKKVELWILLLVIWFGLIFTIVFSWSLKSELIGWKRAGILGRIAYNTSNIPTLIYDIFQYKKTPEYHPLILKNIWPEINGFSKYGKISPNVYNDMGYLLLSAYSESKKQSTVKLIRINDQHIIHEWVPDIDAIRKIHKKIDVNELPRDFNFTYLTKNRFRIFHPLLLNDGSLIFHHSAKSFLIKISKCSDIIWTANNQHHHSLEQDIQENIWTPTRIYPSVYDTINEIYRDDAIAQINQNGEVIYEKSVTEILIENGYQALLWGVGQDAFEWDPIHLNDIQPTLSSSKFWEVGDLFISIKNKSTVFLYRPQTNKILWLKTGPWLNQHDVNILNQSQISVFNNNVISTSSDAKKNGNNNVYIFDFEKSAVLFPYDSILKELDVMTWTEGRSKILENGDVFVEETNNGRLLRVSTDTTKWEFTATIDSNYVGLMSWSRYLTYNEIKDVLPILENSECQKQK